MINIYEEASRCLLCIDAACNRACTYDTHPARGLRAVRFDDASNAGLWLTDKCATCDAPCEQACIHPDRPVRIKGIASIVNGTYPADGRSQSADFPGSLPDLGIDFCGIHCENPFFLASSAICTDYDMIARAFDMGWAGVVYKTISYTEIKEVSPRFDAVRYGREPFYGFRNMEQLSEKSAEENLEIISRLKKNYPNKVVVASIMGSNEQEWIDLAQKVEEAGADMVELNFSCPQMKLAGMGSDVGQNPELVIFFSGYVKNAVKIPVIAKMTPNITHISEPAMAAYFAGCDGIAAINTIKSITMGESAEVNGKRTVSGYSGKAVKPIALKYILEMSLNPLMHKSDQTLQLSGIGGIETWRDALEFIQLGCQNVQVCTAVMQYGYRIIEDLKLGLQSYMAEKGISRLNDLVGSELASFRRAGDLDRDTMVFPMWDYEKCLGCGRCYISCSDAGHQAIIFGNDRKPQLDGKKCVGCHLCRLVCPVGAIGTARRFTKKK